MTQDQIICGDSVTVLRGLPDTCVQTCVTSPPYYGLRDYGHDGQIGLEETPDLYVARLVEVFREVWRVMKDDGTLWLNLGDSCAGSGKGYMADGTVAAGTKQSTNKGSVQISSEIVRSSRGARIGSVHSESGHTSGVKPPFGWKSKDLLGIPWFVAFALRADGWYLRSDVIWNKPNPMPESVTDRPTKSHEYIFLLSKNERYYYDAEAIAEPANYDGRKDEMMKGSEKYNAPVIPGQAAHTFALNGHERWRKDENGNRIRNKRSVWTVNTKPYAEAHFATFPPDLIKPCILAGSKPGDVVLDPFFGSGTTGFVARELGRHFIGIDLNLDYIKLAEKRIISANIPLPGLESS